MELKLIETPKNIKQALNTPMPDYIVKQKPDANKSNYVSGQSVIDKLNSVFGHCGWSWRIVESKIVESRDKVIKTRWNSTTRRKEELETPIIEKQNPVAHVVGEITVYFERPDGSIFSIVRQAPGAQSVTGGQSEQENIFKAAHTDALKKAATMFGIALELYRDENETYFFNELNYENPWTEEAMAENKENFEFLKNFKAQYGLSDDDMNGYINQYSGGQLPTTDYIMPDNIAGFCAYLNELMKKGA